MGSRLEQNSNQVRKRIENHTFSNEDGDEYEGSRFGGFNEYFRRKKIKLQNLDAELRSQSDKPAIFKGTVCHVNGYTQPSLNDLHTIIVEHGGGFIQYLDGKTMVTHIIASNLTPKKKEEFKRYRIVKPAWVVDSVKAGKLLPWDQYRIVDEGVAQKVLGFGNGQMVSQANPKVQGYREQTDSSWYTNQLKSQVEPRRPPKLTQTITPEVDDIDEDEYSLPELTSSIEKVLDNGNEVGSAECPSQQQAIIPPHTPPPSSPTIISHQSENSRDQVCPQDPVNKSHLRPRQGSQEPDFSHAVVRNSKILNAISPERLARMTAEEHNALLLADPNIRKSTVVNPDFIEQYYRESRLHHLSTWKADLKTQLQALAAEKTSTQKDKQKRLPGQRRYIMHVDFDSFFVAVSMKKHPQFNHLPAVVAHGGGSGSEIASCNYPAREFGVSNGMWMKRAQELCPDLKVLPYDFPGYEETSRKFYDMIMATGGIVQSVSIDEALIDISAICFAESGSDGVERDDDAVHREQIKADVIAQKLRDDVLEVTGCAVSVGIGGNILQAKVALRKAKPAGQYQLKPEDVLEFIGQLEVQKLPGVAWSIGGKLGDIGIKFVKDVRETTKEKLVNTLGPKTGEKIWEYARGIDRTEVGDQVVRKSVSAEVNWGVRFENQEQVDEFIHGLCGELRKRLLKERVKGKQLTMKLMKRAADAPLDPPKHLGHGKCDVYNKSVQLGVATNDQTILAREAIVMMKAFNISPGELRGIGIQMQKLEPIKAGVDGADCGSQRRLQFKAGPSKLPPAQTMPTEDPIQDEQRTPQKRRIADFNQPSAAFKPIALGTFDKKPLNVFGTQFVLPTQVDPGVLAELPEDIRAKLIRKGHATAAAGVRQGPKAAARSDSTHSVLEEADSGPSRRTRSPALGIPPQSQLDPAILLALPEDVRQEVLELYRQPQPPQNLKRTEQALLPQSPRKQRTLPPPPPVKRGRGRPRGGGLSSKLRNAAMENSTLTQSNFVARVATADPSVAAFHEEEELDPEVLAALPDDLRQEVLAQQRQTRLQRMGGIDTSLHHRPRTARSKQNPHEAGPIERSCLLPPKPTRPTFTSRKLSMLPELRQAVSGWVREFNDEGPYEDDVDALVHYLQAVVKDEHDVGKAVSVVKWLVWVVDECEEKVSHAVQNLWKEACKKVKLQVQSAATARGLGRLVFD